MHKQSESPDSVRSIEELVDQLSGGSPSQRIAARNALVEIGPSVVPAVSALANSSEKRDRWECAKTLCEIADPTSIETLIRLLEDSADGTRWDAAVGLIAIGKPTVTPLLKAIIGRAREHAIIPGARHVIHQLSKLEWGESLRPVFEALNGYCPNESSPIAANYALDDWERDEQRNG